MTDGAGHTCCQFESTASSPVSTTTPPSYSSEDPHEYTPLRTEVLDTIDADILARAISEDFKNLPKLKEKVKEDDHGAVRGLLIEALSAKVESRQQ